MTACSKVVSWILERPDHGLRGQSMANGILGRALFAALRFWAGAPLGVAAVGFDLSKRSHVAVPGNWVRFAIRGSQSTRTNQHRICRMFPARGLEDFGAGAGQRHCMARVHKLRSSPRATIIGSFVPIHSVCDE